MRFGRFEQAGRPRFWGVVDAERPVVQPIVGSFDIWASAYLEVGADSLPLSGEHLAIESLTRLAPFEPGSRVFCCGARYVGQGGADAPDYPTTFLKLGSSLVDPDAEISYASFADKLDYEVELVAVIGRPIKPGTASSAALLGYTIGNDVTIRYVGGLAASDKRDFFLAKIADCISPLGPEVVSVDELGASGQPALEISLRVNGAIRQHDNTKEVRFSVEDLVEWVNRRSALLPGDIIFTGSPAGTATENNQGFLRPGDVVEAEIEGIGVLRNIVGQKET